ncbi:type II restriction endonuclease [Pelistega sp. MC2]|uniref:type II restriction endonuclease n=1 Tax=Pelistega sp. MC2 TaxID=1720297 RepID=UPI0008DAD8ED|nr:type II restriction endonuclease [Pelistega sp. MC2]
MKKEFPAFISTFSETNATLGYFTDFDKVKENVKKIELHLNQLNYLLGKENLNQEVHYLYASNPKCFEALDILIAVRREEKKKTLNNQGQAVEVSSYLTSPDMIIEFLEETGLAGIFKDRTITNLVDYVFGIEVGLDTNTRKNRGGKNMSTSVSLLFDNANVFYRKEVRNTTFPEIISLGADVKQFDFVIRTQKKTYLIETNYYNSGGSKLNEVARAYSDVAPKINQYPNFEFIWITDGQGWNTAKNKLEEAYNLIPSVYSLATLPDFISQLQSEGIITNW